MRKPTKHQHYRPTQCIRVQSTVFPERAELGYITDLNTWYLHIKMITDAYYAASRAIDLTIGGEMALNEAIEILNNTSIC